MTPTEKKYRKLVGKMFWTVSDSSPQYYLENKLSRRGGVFMDDGTTPHEYSGRVWNLVLVTDIVRADYEKSWCYRLEVVRSTSSYEHEQGTWFKKRCNDVKIVDNYDNFYIRNYRSFCMIPIENMHAEPDVLDKQRFEYVYEKSYDFQI
jgi:hypothetical protein